MQGAKPEKEDRGSTIAIAAVAWRPDEHLLESALDEVLVDRTGVASSSAGIL